MWEKKKKKRAENELHIVNQDRCPAVNRVTGRNEHKRMRWRDRNGGSIN